MKPVLTAALLASGLAFASSALADTPPSPERPLQILYSGEKASMFVAPDTVRRDGDAASVWTVFLLKIPAANVPSDFAGGWSLQRFTCSAHIGETDTAAMLNLKLEIMDPGGHPRAQKAINPNSPQELAYRLACQGDQSVLGASVANLQAAFDSVQGH